MVHRFWRSDFFLVWIRYVAAGVAMVPAGVLYLMLLHSLSQKQALTISCTTAVIVGFAASSWLGYVVRTSRLKSFARDDFSANEMAQNKYPETLAWAAAAGAWSGNSTSVLIQHTTTASFARSYASYDQSSKGADVMMVAG